MLTISLSEAPALLAAKAKGGRVFLPGGPVEPTRLAAAFADQPQHAAHLSFCGMMIPGINTIDWAAIHAQSGSELFLPSPDLAATIATGQTRILPLHYSAAYRYLCDAPFKAAVFHICPPNDQGLCNLSLSADSSPAFFNRDVFKLGIINYGLPVIRGAPSVPIAMFDTIIEIDQAPLTISASTAQESASTMAAHVAALVEDGATLQAGIGKLPGAVMAALSAHRSLRLHSGLIGDWALDLMRAGAFDQGQCALTAGVILGSNQLHQALANDTSVSLVPISETHCATKLANVDRFTALNAALEIDLFGQINCEYAGSHTLAGIGGALDFLRGARASRGGKPIVMIACEGKGGVSRIVPRLTTPTISISRADAPILVTEHGSIDLETLDTRARAHALIALAGPSHREALAKAWEGMRS